MKTIIITQYLRPNGKKADIFAQVPDDLYELAMSLSISCELLPTDIVAIYAHRRGESAEDELSEMASNGPGSNSPEKALERLIRRFKTTP